MSFAHAHNTTITGRNSFVDIQGDFIYNAQGLEAGLHTLLPAVSRSAAYDAEERRPPPQCHPGTRVELLNNIRVWIEDMTGKDILWVHGPAGAGKSAIAQTVCESCAERGELLASFFFSRAASDRHHIKKLIPTLAFQIALSQPDKRQLIHHIVEEDPLVMNRTIPAQLKKLIIEPFQHDSVLSQPRISPFLIVIDGLDECSGTRDQTLIVSLIYDLVETHQLPLRFLIFSRPEPSIEHAFRTRESVVFEISLLGDRQAEDDIRIFLRSEFERIHDSEMHSDIMKHISKPWPSDDDLQLLVKRSDGYFIYASTLIKYVDEENFSCISRLHQVFDASTLGSTAFAELDKLYAQVLSTCSNISLLKSIFGCFFFSGGCSALAGELAVAQFTALFDLQPGEVMLALRGLRSIIRLVKALDDEEDWIISPSHASLPEFLFDVSRSGIYFIDEQECHEQVVRRSMIIYRDWESRKDTINPAWKRYTSIWVDHFEYSKDPSKLVDLIRETVPRSAWEYYVEDSDLGSVNSRVHLADMLSIAIVVLEKLERPPEDLIQGFGELRGLAFDVGLNPTSDVTTKAVRDTYAIYCVVPHVMVDEDNPLMPSEAKQVMYSEAFARNYVPWDDVNWGHFHGYIQCMMMKIRYGFIEEYDLRRSTPYYTKEVCHSQIACYCLGVLTDVSNSRYIEGVVEYSRNHWVAHLILSNPNDETLLDHFRNIWPESLSSIEFDQVWEWFQKTQDPPAELLLRWNNFALKFKDIHVDLNIDFET